jgi:predicted O-linked N-acetylglucosamine transferase (SPINDLY family)
MAKELFDSNKLREIITTFECINEYDKANILFLRLKLHAYYSLKQYDLATYLARKIIQLNPCYGQHYSDLFACLEASDNKEEIFDQINIAVKNLPEKNFAELIEELIASESFILAKSLLDAAIINNDNYKLHVLLGKLYIKQRLYALATSVFKVAIEINQNDADAWHNMAISFQMQGDLLRAIDCIERAWELDKFNLDINQIRAELYNIKYEGTGNQILFMARSMLKLIKEVKQVLPAALCNNLLAAFSYTIDHRTIGNIYNIKNFAESFVKAPKILPLMYEMDRVKTMEDRYNLLKLHQQWGENICKNIKPYNKQKPVRSSSKKYRLGLITAYDDIHVGKAIMPLVKYLDSDKFDFFAYVLPSEKNIFYELASRKSHALREIVSYLQPDAIASIIADDNLDIFIDPGPGFNIPEVAAFKPAYRMITWLDYPHSSGLPFDYIVTDPYINCRPDLLLEKPLLLPETWMTVDYDSYAPETIIDYLPQEINGYITFGTLNAPFKISPQAIKTWAELLHAVPNSKFLYSRPAAAMETLRNNFIRQMAEYGIDKSRLSFVIETREHLKIYNLIDIALDTFPRTGGTTTCESLWMGVPVVSLVGPAFYERLSYSNLNNAGLNELCAFSIDEYKDIALTLVKEKSKRRKLRQTLRQNIFLNPLGKAENFVRNFSDAMIAIL